MIVVSDTSPILNLARIGRLELLPSLYYRVLIPAAVYEELTASKDDLSSVIDLGSVPWLTVATANDRKRVQELREHLDPGEAEAIVFAIAELISCLWMKDVGDGLPLRQASR